jgi:hypothetical protein
VIALAVVALIGFGWLIGGSLVAIAFGCVARTMGEDVDHRSIDGVARALLSERAPDMRPTTKETRRITAMKLVVVTTALLTFAFATPALAQGPSWGGSRSPAQQQYRPTPNSPTGGYYNPQTDPFILKQPDLTVKQPYHQRNDNDADDASRLRHAPSVPGGGTWNGLCCR